MKVSGYVMGKGRTEGKYIMLDIRDVRLVEKLHECLIEDASLAMDNKQYNEAEQLLRDANRLAELIAEYNEPKEDNVVYL